jgi:hypothetical protein
MQSVAESIRSSPQEVFHADLLHNVRMTKAGAVVPVTSQRCVRLFWPTQSGILKLSLPVQLERITSEMFAHARSNCNCDLRMSMRNHMPG